MTENPRPAILRQARRRTRMIALGAAATTTALTGVIAYHAVVDSVAGDVPPVQYFGLSDDDSDSGGTSTQPDTGIQPGSGSDSSDGESHSS